MSRKARWGWLVCLMLGASLNAVAQQPNANATAIEELGELDYDKRAAARVREAATRILEKTFSARVKELIPKLGNDSFDIRQQVENELLEIGAPALAALRVALKDADLEVSRRAAKAIDAITRRLR